MRKEELLKLLFDIDNNPEEIRKFLIEEINDRAIKNLNEILPIKERGKYQITAFDVLTLVREAPYKYDTDLLYKIDGDYHECQVDEVNHLSSFLSSILEENYETSEWERTYNDLMDDLDKRVKENYKTERLQNYINEFGYELSRKEFSDFYYD